LLISTSERNGAWWGEMWFYYTGRTVFYLACTLMLSSHVPFSSTLAYILSTTAVLCSQTIAFRLSSLLCLSISFYSTHTSILCALFLVKSNNSNPRLPNPMQGKSAFLRSNILYYNKYKSLKLYKLHFFKMSYYTSPIALYYIIILYS